VAYWDRARTSFSGTRSIRVRFKVGSHGRPEKPNLRPGQSSAVH